MTVVICDLDGTLCDHRHRVHLALSGDWDAYHALLSKDEPHSAVLNFLKDQSMHNEPIYFLTGRPEQYRTQTIAWLRDVADLHLLDDFKDLLMRPKGDFSSDVELKKQGLDAIYVSQSFKDYARAMIDGRVFKSEEGKISFVGSRILFLEDRDKLVEMWRDMGYACWQTARGEL